jgi:hypothetical protein
MSKYPAAIDTEIELPKIVSNVTPVTGDIINKLRNAVVAVESELGVKPSGIYSNVRARMSALETALANITAGSSTTFGRDLSTLTLITQKVIGLQGRDVSDAAPSDGYLLTWNESLTKWEPAEAPVSFIAGGDISGSNTSQTVIALQGNAVSNAMPDSNQLLTWTGATWTPQDPPVSFTAGGDLSGNNTSQTVIAIQGRIVENVNPTDGHVLTWEESSTTWKSKEAQTTSVQNGSNYGNFVDVPVFANITSTSELTFVNAGYFEFDPTLLTSANGTREIKLRIIAETTGPLMTIQLYNITNSTIVTGSTLTTVSAEPVVLESGDLSSNILGSSAIYQVQIKMDAGAESDQVNLGSAGLRISWF